MKTVRKIAYSISNKLVFLVVVVAAIDLAWDLVYPVKVPLDSYRYVILSASGGEGKSTLAKKISELRKMNYISLDDCKFGENWSVNSTNEFEGSVKDKIKGSYVFEGIYKDSSYPVQQKVMNELIVEADTVIWLDVPKWVTVWRKLARSAKRKLGLIEKGTCKETLSSIKSMVEIGLEEHDANRESIKNLYSSNPDKILHIKWPHVPVV